MTELEYMTAKIYALSSQLHFFSGQTHPYYDYALKEFTYIINEIAKRPAHKKGVKIARSIRYRLENEDEERRATKTFVSCLSPAQAYRLAEAAIHHRIKLKTAYELYLEELDEEESDDEESDDGYDDSYDDTSAF
jgi:hypothetical protein